MKRTLTIAVLLGLTACASDATPARPASNLSNSSEMSIMEIVWSESAQSDRDDVCMGYNALGPREAFVYWNEGADGAVSYSTFKTYLDAHC